MNKILILTVLALAIPSWAEDLPGKLLEGPSKQLARSALGNYTGPGVPDSEILFDQDDLPFVATTHFIVVLKDKVTVGQVNGALKSMNARITGMTRDGNTLEIRIPEPKNQRSLADVEAVVAKLRTLSVFADALPVSFQGSVDDPALSRQKSPSRTAPRLRLGD
jgi:hypothetical protein